MIAHYFKLIWKQKRKNAFLLVELILVFWVIFAVFTVGISRLKHYSTPRGFDSDGVYRVGFNATPDADTVTLKSYVETMLQNLVALDNVENASYSTIIGPYSESYWSNQGTLDNDVSFYCSFVRTDEDYSKVWNLKMKSGRFYTKEDFNGKYTPVVVTQKFADDHLKGREPLGITFNFDGREVKIIGVVENFKYQGDFTEEEPFIFCPLRSWKETDLLTFKVKKGTGSEIQKTVNDLVQNITKSSDFDIVKVDDSRKAILNKTLVPLLSMLFLALFLIINIAMGLFGILRYTIAQRVSEIGLRKAIGATSGAIRRQFTGEVLAVTTVAFVIAFAFAVQVPFVTTWPIEMDSFFIGIGLGVILIFGIVYFCSLIPSHRAAGIPPAEALRED